MTPIIRARIPFLWSTVREERWSNVFSVLNRRNEVSVCLRKNEAALSLLMNKLVFARLLMSKNKNSSFMCISLIPTSDERESLREDAWCL